MVAITGAVDRVTDGVRTAELRGGHPMMAQVSGMGCVAGAMIAAWLVVEPDAFVATGHALAVLGAAADVAAVTAAGPGSLVPALLDALHRFDGEPRGAV